jgi:hypothetical protein
MPPEPAPHPTEVYRSLRGKMLAVQIVFAIIIGAACVAVASDAFHLNVLTRIDQGEPVSAEQVNATDLAQTVIAVLQRLSFLAGAIVFIVWLTAAYRNVDALAPGERRYHRLWAGIGWFVPIWAYFRPVQVVNDVRRAAGGGLDLLVGAWWTLWLVERMWALIASIGGVNAEETGTEVGQTGVLLVDDVLLAITGTLALLVAVRVSNQFELQAATVAHRHQTGDARRFDPEVHEGDRRAPGQFEPAAGE